MDGIENKQGLISLINAVLADDVDLNTSRGVIEGRKSLNAVGNIDAVGNTEKVISGLATFTGFLTSPDKIRIKAGGDSNDDINGSGARTIEVFGLDENFNMINETIETNGSSASLSTSSDFIRLFTARVVNSGTYSSGLDGSNVDDITIETETGTELGVILEERGITQSSMRTIPAGYTGFLVSLSARVDGDKTGTISIWGRGKADITSAPFGASILLGRIANIVGRKEKALKTFPPIQEKTDIWATAVKTEGGGNTSAGVDYQLILIKNT